MSGRYPRRQHVPRRTPTHAPQRYSVREDMIECTCGKVVTPASAYRAHREHPDEPRGDA